MKSNTRKKSFSEQKHNRTKQTQMLSIIPCDANFQDHSDNLTSVLKHLTLNIQQSIIKTLTRKNIFQKQQFNTNTFRQNLNTKLDRFMDKHSVFLKNHYSQSKFMKNLNLHLNQDKIKRSKRKINIQTLISSISHKLRNKIWNCKINEFLQIVQKSEVYLTKNHQYDQIKDQFKLFQEERKKKYKNLYDKNYYIGMFYHKNRQQQLEIK